MADERFLVVGLGNPGRAYARTRHNAGFLVVTLLAERTGSRFKAFKGAGGRAEVAETRLAGSPVVLAGPQSYMNESGGPVAAVARFYNVPVERVVIVHDDLDLPYGVLRLKRGGGDGGHNGLRSITASLGSRDYLRVRLGIGRPPGRQDPADYVLSEFSTSERKELGYHIDRAADAIEALIQDGLEHAQNVYNSNGK
jgi:PTH1 family peptidyl-tRNA hydrolase